MSVNQVPVGTIRDIACVECEWNIENYIKLSAGRKDDFYFTSPSFEILAATWNLYLYPNVLINHLDSSLNCYIKSRFRHSDSSRNCYTKSSFISIFLEKKCSKVEDHHVFYSLEMKDGENILSDFNEKACFKENSRYGNAEFLKVSSLSEYMSGDTLTVSLHIRPTDSTIQHVKSYTDFTKTSEGVNLLSSNMKNLYLNQQDCDFTIRVKTREFKVHKVILAAQSPVLYSMLHNNMAESRTGIVDIVDSEPDIFENFLLYLYSGKVEGLSWKNVTQLFMLGDKYDLQYLKNKCRSYMLSHICKDGFCDVVVLAVKHNERTLLKCAEDYFIKNAKSILSSKKWQEFLYENPIACNELFLKFVSSLSSDSSDSE